MSALMEFDSCVRARPDAIVLSVKFLPDIHQHLLTHHSNFQSG
jgi:hypothetical protein